MTPKGAVDAEVRIGTPALLIGLGVAVAPRRFLDKKESLHKVVPETVQGILRHADVRTAVQLYAHQTRIETRSSGRVLDAATRRQGSPARGDDPAIDTLG